MKWTYLHISALPSGLRILPGFSELHNNIFKIFIFLCISEFLSEARHVFQVETWLVPVVNPHETPRMHSTKAIQIWLRCATLWLPRVSTSNRLCRNTVRAGSCSSFVFSRGHTQTAEIFVRQLGTVQVSAAQLTAAPWGA